MLEKALGLLNAVEPASFLQRRDAASAIRNAAEYFPEDREKLLQMAKAPASGIAGVLWTFNETMGWNLGALRTTEANALADYDRLNATLSKEYADMDAIKKGKEVELADHQDEIAKATTERDATQTSKDSDESFVAGLITRCDEKAAEYQHRNELRSMEDAAGAQAIAILDSDAAFATFGAAKATSTGATSALFLQESLRRTKGRRQDIEATVATITATLERAAKKSGSLRLSNLAAKLSAKTIPLHNVDDNLVKMIGVIDREEAKDVATLAVCEDEQTGGGEDKETKESALSTLNDTFNTGIKDSTKSIEDNEDSLASNRESQAEETADRAAENSAYIKNVENLEEAEKILTKSIEVLTKYYDYLERTNAPKTYVEHSGKDSLGANYKRLPTASQEELEEACNADANCLGFTSEGWLKDGLNTEEEWIDVGYNLYVKTTERTAGHAAFLQEEPETWGEEAEGQRGQGAEVLNMLRYILSQTTKEREDAISDEEQAVTDFDTTMTNLKNDETTLIETLQQLETTLADQKQSLQEAEEDQKVTEKQLTMITAYLEKILPGCTWIQENYDARAQGRADEKAGLEEAVDQIEPSPKDERMRKPGWRR